MKFEMNGRTFTIKIASQNELCGDVGEQNEKCSHYFGRFKPYNQEILLSEELSNEQQRYTLIHELTHCYIWSYMCKLETLNEEDICNIHSNSHYVIHKIIEDYFRVKEDLYEKDLYM